MTHPEYSFVIPVLDEIDSLELLYNRLRPVMPPREIAICLRTGPR